MRWDNLFEDLEGQLAAASQLDHEAEVAELARAEQGAVGLADRLRGHGEAPVDLLLSAGVRFRGVLRQVAETWLVLESPPRTVLVPLRAVVTVAGLGRQARSEASVVRRSLSLASALRGLARDRAPVTCIIDSGCAEPMAVAGTIDTVGADYLEIAPAGGEDAPARGVRGWGGRGRGAALVVPFSAVIAVRSGG